MRRRYGFFRCKGCKSRWESSHVYCDNITDQPIASYTQQCKKCSAACLPYKWEPMTCSICGLKEDCSCTREDKAKRHVDPNKPHRADLCAKCRSGNLCTHTTPSSATSGVVSGASSSRTPAYASPSRTPSPPCTPVYSYDYESYGTASYGTRIPTEKKSDSYCTII